MKEADATVMNDCEQARPFAAQRARYYYKQGANCAEAVLLALPEALGREDIPVPPAAAAAWAGGIADQGCLCGALAAAVLVAGACAATEHAERKSRDRTAAAAAAKINQAFEERFGSSCCRSIRRRLDPERPQSTRHCADITAETAGIAASVLEPFARRPAGDEDPVSRPAASSFPLSRYGSTARRALTPPLLGLLLGLEVAWVFVQWSWLDMRYNAGLAIPVGAGVGLVWSIVAWRRAQSIGTLGARGASIVGALALIGGLPLMWSLLFERGTAEAMSILALEGFGLRGLMPVEAMQWTLFGLSVLGLLLAVTATDKAVTG